MLNVSTFGNTADIYAIVHLVPHASAYHGRPEPQQRWYSCKNLKISGEWRHKECPSQTPRRKSRTTVMHHLLFVCVLSTFVASFNWDTLARLCSEPESRLVERCNHYCLHSTVASASFLTCFMDLWITLHSPFIFKSQAVLIYVINGVYVLHKKKTHFSQCLFVLLL